MRYEFPKNFLWGAATASHQIEGGLTNNWTQWELKIALRNSKGGIRPTVESLENMASEKDNYISNSKYSPESFKHWKKDLEVIKKLGLKAYRLSVEWSRIEPEKGKFSKEGIQYYKDLLKELKKNDIKVVLTCWHWTTPLWLEKEGGLLGKNVIEYFERYVSFLANELSEYVDYWITINEPGVVSVEGYLTGSWPPGKKNPILFHRVYKKIMVDMHISAYKAIKEIDSEIPISLAKSIGYTVAYNKMPWNILLNKVSNWYMTYSFLDKIVEYMDYIGINYYFYSRIGVMGQRNDNDRLSDLGWWLRPDKLYEVIKMIDERYNLPIIITENGLADSRDKYRRWWIEESVKAMHKAIEDGCEVFGYLHWSLLDNFEWDKGYWPKFGLVSVDPYTKERTIKGSGNYYTKIIENDGIQIEKNLKK